MQQESNRQLKLSRRQQMILIIKSNGFEIVMICLVLIYVLIVFAYFLLDDLGFIKQQREDYLLALNITELVILMVFIVETVMNSLAYGFKFYFRTRLMLFDAIVIVLSFVLVLLEISDVIESTNNTIQLLFRILRAIFRFLRVFILFRKLNIEYQQIHKKVDEKYAQSQYSNSTPSEKVIEILTKVKNRMKENNSENKYISNIIWCIEIISKNKLYDPIILQKHNSEMIQWIKSQSGTRRRNRQAVNCVSKKRVTIQMQLSVEQNNNRAGLYRVNSTDNVLPQNVIELLENKVDKLEFQTIKYYGQTQKQGLTYMFGYIMNRHGLDMFLGIEQQKVMNYMRKIEKEYLDVPYHSAAHGSDVLQTLYFFIYSCKLNEVADMIDLEILSLLFSAAVHDVGHPGTTNMFQRNVVSQFSLNYNDQSVLEMHHCSIAFNCLKEEGTNIFSNLKAAEFDKARSIIISAILSTDMSQHHRDQGILKGRIQTADFSASKNEKDKKIVMNHALHTADISGSIKPWDISEEWCMRVTEEFFNQGDQERDIGVDISYLMDRYSTNVAKSQIGFIDYIIIPTIDLMKSYLPLMSEHDHHLHKNRQIWETKIDYYDDHLKQLNVQKDKNI